MKPHCPGAVAMVTAQPAAIVFGKMVAPVKPGWMGTSRTGGAIAGGIGEGLKRYRRRWTVRAEPCCQEVRRRDTRPDGRRC